MLILLADWIELKMCYTWITKGIEKSIFDSFRGPKFHISAMSPSPVSRPASLPSGSLSTQLILWFCDREHRRAPCQQQDQERKSAGSPLLPSLHQRGSRIPLPVLIEGSNFLLCCLGICLMLASSL